MKKKIGIMGGTFNPIHLAHLQMASIAMEQKKLDEVWFIRLTKTGRRFCQKRSGPIWSGLR